MEAEIDLAATVVTRGSTRLCGYWVVAPIRIDVIVVGIVGVIVPLRVGLVLPAFR